MHANVLDYPELLFAAVTLASSIALMIWAIDRIRRRTKAQRDDLGIAILILFIAIVLFAHGMETLINEFRDPNQIT